MVALRNEPRAERELQDMRLDRGTRVRAVLGVIPRIEDAGFSPVLDALVVEAFERHVVRAARRLAPEVLESPFMTKLRAGFTTYCGLGISAVVCARRRPMPLSLGARVVRALRLRPATIARVGIALLPPFFRRLRAREVERIALCSFLILALDEVLDDVLEGTPSSRADALARLVRERTVDVGAPPLVRLCAGVLAHLFASSSPRERMAFASVLEGVVAWAQDEVALEVPGSAVDPRRRTIEVSMRLLGFGAGDVIQARELAWMQRIAALGQMVDDVVDAQKDAAAGRRTPGVTGEWDADTVAVLYARNVEDMDALLDEAGERCAAIRELYVRTLRCQLRRMAEILVENP